MAAMRSVFRPDLLASKVCIVSGGGSGIGFGIAAEMLSLGARVVIASRNVDKCKKSAERLVEQTGVEQGRILALRCNIREEDDVAALMQQTADAFGPVDLLVNNAGGQFPSPTAALSKKGWHAVLETNLTGTFLMCKHAYLSSMSGRGGAIVNVIADVSRGFPGMAHTGAARAAVENLTKTLAAEWASDGVRINCVAPGIIWSQSAADNYGDSDFLTSKRQACLMKRLGTVEEVSAAVCFLLSPAASFITGTTMAVDGGGPLGEPLFQVSDHDKLPAFGVLPDSAKL